MIQNLKDRGLYERCGWKTGQDIYDWWVGEATTVSGAQLSLLETEDEQ